MALLEPGASCPGARLWIRALSSCGRRRRGRQGDQRDPQPWNCAGSVAGEFSALVPRYPISLLRDLRSSSGRRCASQLGSPWRPGSPGNGAYPGPGCELLERWVLPPCSNFTRTGDPRTHFPACSQPPCHNSRDPIVTRGDLDPRRARTQPEAGEGGGYTTLGTLTPAGPQLSATTSSKRPFPPLLSHPQPL